MFECMRCIHTDSPCLSSDYGRDEHDYCDHFKDMFECMRCIHTDSPCLPSDYGRDEHDYCDHFKDMFEENVELKAQNSKATEIIRDLLGCLYSVEYDRVTDLEEAEQYLKEVKENE